MSDLDFDFDANSVEPAAPFEVIPAGNYVAQVVQVEKRTTNAGTGAYLWMEMEICDGEYHGRKLWHRLNIWNPNETAKQIAAQELSAICHSIQTPQIRSFEQLVMKPMTIVVKVKPAGPDKQGIHREAQNEIKGFKPAGPTTATARPAAPARPVAVAGTGGAARPAGGPAWGRRPN